MKATTRTSLFLLVALTTLIATASAASAEPIFSPPDELQIVVNHGCTQEYASSQKSTTGRYSDFVYSDFDPTPIGGPNGAWGLVWKSVSFGTGSTFNAVRYAHCVA